MDATTSLAKQVASLAIIVRKHEGQVMLSGGRSRCISSYVAIFMALAILFGLQVALEANLHKL